MELLIESIKMDWPVLLPILICSILVVGVVISKWSFYKRNQRDIAVYMRELDRALDNNDLRAAQDTAINCGGVIGEVIEEAVRIFSEQKKGFSRSFDISSTKILFFPHWFVIIMNLVDETGSEKPKSTNCKPGGKKNEKEKIINCIGSSNTCIIHGWMWLFRRKRLW